jgi:hypothetical protein
MLKIKKFRKLLKVVLFVVFLILWGCWVNFIYSNINHWLNKRVETVVLHSRTLEEPKLEYSVYERRNASQTFHFSEPQNIEKIIIPVILPVEAVGGSQINVTIKKDDLTVWDEKTYELKTDRNELVVYPGERFNQTSDLRVIFTTPGKNDIDKAPRIYREETGNIALRILSSDVRKNLIFIKNPQPQDYVKWLKWGLFFGFIMIFPIVFVSFFVRGKKGGNT